MNTVPAEIIGYHAERNHFSVWLKAHTEFEVAEKLRPRKREEFPSTDALRDHIANVERSLASIIAILDQRLFLEKAGSGRISNTEIARLKRMFVASLSPEGDS